MPQMRVTPFTLWSIFLLIHCLAALTSAADDNKCPARCRCPPDHNNTVVDCSRSYLTAPPRLSLDTKKLSLSHNALGPIINASFPKMGNLVDFDLSYNGLVQLLGCTLQGMLTLNRLSLRGNRLTSLPDGLFADTADLEYLDISHNIITSIPNHVFRVLTNLKHLDASHNRMTNLKFGNELQATRHLLTINLSHNLFDTIEEDAFDSAKGWEPGLKRTLNLAHCRLFSIESPVFSSIPELSDLDLSGNSDLPLENVTSVVKDLNGKGLERLSLSSLNLTELQPFLAEANELSLKFLNVSDNAIENIPGNTFSTISSLLVLDISRNKLSSLDAAFSALQNLKVLNASFNSMTGFKGERVSKVEVLDISYNKLADPGEVKLGPLKNLTYLDVSENYMKEVVLPDLTENLKHFDYHANAITKFSGFNDVPKIEYFDISDNYLKVVEDHALFPQSRFLKLVNFSKNNISKLNTNAFRTQSSLVVDLSDNYIEKIQFSNWRATQELYLNNNNIKEVDFASFHLMDALRILDLSNNHISSLHDDLLHHAYGLKYLNLSHNSIQQTNFPLLFRHLRELEILDLGNNNISHLNETMLEPIPLLKSFSLSQNQLKVVKPRVFRDLKHIKVIDLSGNPFVCDCENLGFQDWLIRTKIVVSGLYDANSTSYLCKGPSNRVGKHVTEWSPDEFECDKTMLYMIICGSAGLTLIVAGVVSTVIYRVYKCHKRKKLEREKAEFRKNCYGEDDEDDDDDDVDGYKNKTRKGGKLDLSKMTSDEIALEITNAIERRERRSMRKAEEQKKKSYNGYAPSPPNGNVKYSDEKKNGHDSNKASPSNGNSKGRRESIEARQYDRIIQQQNEEAKLRRSVERESRERRSEGGRYTSRLEEDVAKSRAMNVHRASAPTTHDVLRMAQQQQRWKQKPRGGTGYGYLEPEPEPDYGYETEPARHGSRESKRYNRWDSLDVWDRDRKGWIIQGQPRSRSQGHNRERYMTLPIREQDIPGHERRRSSRREAPKMFLDPYTNEVRIGYEDQPRRRSDRKQHPPPPPRQSRWDAYNYQQQLQQHYKPRSRSLHYLPQEHGDPRPKRYADNSDEERRYIHHQHQRSEDDRHPLIGPAPTRAKSQPYLASENTSDWL